MGGKYLKNAPAPKGPRKGLITLLIVLAVFVVLGTAGVVVARMNGIKTFSDIPKKLIMVYAGMTNKAEDITVPTVPSDLTVPSADPTTGDEQGKDPSDPTTETEPTWPEIVSTQNVTTFMLVGQNYRAGEEHYLSDSMILCTVNRDTKTLTMTSLLRDLYVPIPAYAGHGPGRNRLNVCYHLGTQWTGSTKGGMEMLALCVEQNFGIPVDHTVELDFSAFEKIIDLMGGVDIELTKAEADYMNSDECAYYGYDPVKEGLQTLNGIQALSYATIRASDSDFNRSGRQRTVINSLINKCKKMGLWDLHKMATEILPMVTTDMTDEEIANYIWEFLPMLADLNIVSQKVPLEKEQMNGDWSYRGIEVEGLGNVLEPNLWSNKKYLQQILGYADVE